MRTGDDIVGVGSEFLVTEFAAVHWKKVSGAVIWRRLMAKSEVTPVTQCIREANRILHHQSEAVISCLIDTFAE